MSLFPNIAASATSLYQDDSCMSLKANEGEANPFFQFHEGCEQQKPQSLPDPSPENLKVNDQLMNIEKITGSPDQPHCLIFDDATIANLRLLADHVFPVFENTADPYSPKDETEILENSHFVYDEFSSMYIHGIGEYFGPTSIANYRAVPHQKVSDIVDMSVAKVEGF